MATLDEIKIYRFYDLGTIYISYYMPQIPQDFLWKTIFFQGYPKEDLKISVVYIR
jgi:hypothetical protein